MGGLSKVRFSHRLTDKFSKPPSPPVVPCFNCLCRHGFTSPHWTSAAPGCVEMISVHRARKHNARVVVLIEGAPKDSKKTLDSAYRPRG